MHVFTPVKLFFSRAAILLMAMTLALGNVNISEASNNGDSVYRFLELTGSARAAALGGNHVALNNPDATLFFANPAYLNADAHGNFGLSYLNHVTDVNMGFVSGAWHFNDIGTFAAGVRFINYGEMRRADATGTDLGSFSANDLALTIGYGRELATNLQLGIAGTAVYSSYDEFTSTGLAVNAGLYYFWEELNMVVGGAVTNIGYQVSRYDNRNEPLPLDIRLGISRRLEYVPLRLNVTLHSLDRWDMETFRDEGESPSFSTNLFRHLTFGGEIMFSENVHARVGYDHLTNNELKTNERLDAAGFSYGVGIRFRGITFDFSRNSFSDLGGITRIGIQTYL
ncbi:MAG: type IX secretion system protein PorQ [Balneolia bacterium]|nr:type IX secretion system protein PorQ [Balneolia bacterium]